MAEVVTFLDYIPPARFDLLPWTNVLVYEDAAEFGTYTLLETIALSPVDTDPSEPAARSFTTELGTAIDYWYKVVFADANGDVSQPSAPVQNTAATVTTPYATVEQLARIIRVDASARAPDLERVLVAAAGEIDSEIGRTIGFSDPAWQLALAEHVNLERAQDLWELEQIPVGVMGMGGETPLVTPRNSWARHRHTLAPLKAEWGLA